MSRYNHPQDLKKKDYIIRLAFGIITVLILSVFCPKDSALKLRYTVGEPWESAALIARDSFDIYKSEGILQRERDSLKRYYEPYYEMNEMVGQMQLERFSHDIDSIGTQVKLTSAQKEAVINMLRDCYRRGILPDSSYQILEERKVGMIHIFSQNESEQAPMVDLKSQQMVYQMIMQENEDVRAVLSHVKAHHYIVSNLQYDHKKSMNQQKEIDQMLTVCSGRVLIGEKIVDRGQIVTAGIAEKLRSYEKHDNERSKTQTEQWSKTGGQVLYIAIFVFLLYIFFYQFRNDYLLSLRSMLFITLLMVFFALLTYGISRYDQTVIYVIPYCILPIFIRIFTDSRTAFITHIITLFLCALALDRPHDFLILQSVTGMTAIYSLRDMQQRSDLFRAAVMVIVAAALTHLCLDLMYMNFFNNTGVKGLEYVALAAGGGLLLLSYLLLIPFERLFNFTSSVTLIELSNVNHPILRRLSEEAPGTFNHSMQVANLAAAVANHIGAKAQLVRTGALYHDIGKLNNPVFFTENQSGTNPHDQLASEDSAQIIIQHVKFGLELASKYNLPQSIRNFIASHHGRSKTKFFYITYMNQHPGQNVNGEIFTYPGPNPTTLEEAILMMADAVEAATRSLTEYTEESISTFVNRIIDSQVKEGYFNQCPITFENIETAKKVFTDKLKSIYHTRISYPELKAPSNSAQRAAK